MCSSAIPGSEAVDTAASRSRWRAPQCAGATPRACGLIGRERGYHGVGFGGAAVGGIVNNRKQFGALMTGVDHLPATYNRAEQAFSIDQPEWGGHLADALDGLVALHDASTIAAVIVEPVAASDYGVLAPPKGYLAAPARDLRQAWHSVDLRRSHHRLWPVWRYAFAAERATAWCRT